MDNQSAPTTADFRKTWETYARSWKVAETEEKRSLYAQSLSGECVYTDPTTQRRGWSELLEYMVEFHSQVPGGHFRTVEFLAHNNRSIARWEMCTGDETVIGVGTSYGEYDSNGKLVTMTGFFEVPAG